MAATAVATAAITSSHRQQQQLHHFRSRSIPSRPSLSLRRPASRLPIRNPSPPPKPFVVRSVGGGDGGNTGGGGGGNGGGGGDGDGDGAKKNRREAILALAGVGRSLESLPLDLAAAVEAGRIPGSIIERFAELEKSAVFRWLMQFGGFKERLLADDLFLAKVAMECGVGIFTKTAAEYERRREKFFKEIDFVIADVVMAIIADFMLVWLPAPTVSLKPPLAISAGSITKFFYSCPENAFQVALTGTSYSLLQRIGAIARNGSKLFVVGTSASLIGTGATNLLINVRKAMDKNYVGEIEEVPILATSVAYGVYMAVSSNLRYQILAGIIEQRILEPLLHNKKLLLSASCFAVRTGNTFLGSLLWVDYARWIGIQQAREYGFPSTFMPSFDPDDGELSWGPAFYFPAVWQVTMHAGSVYSAGKCFLVYFNSHPFQWQKEGEETI